MPLRLLIFVFYLGTGFALYQNCAKQENTAEPGEAPSTNSKALPGSVDMQKTINLAPQLSENAGQNIKIELGQGEVMNAESPLAGQCLNAELLADIKSFLEESEVCQDEPDPEANICTMDLVLPWVEVHLTDQNQPIGLGRGNNCPRTPTYLCENNEALKALVANIDSEQDFTACP